jgi:hypothetical protein
VKRNINRSIRYPIENISCLLKKYQKIRAGWIFCGTWRRVAHTGAESLTIQAQGGLKVIARLFCSCQPVGLFSPRSVGDPPADLRQND